MGQPTFSTISEGINEDESQKRVKLVDSCEGIERRGTARVGTERDGTREDGTERDGSRRDGTARHRTERTGSRDDEPKYFVLCFVNESQAKHAVWRAMIPRMTDRQ